MAAQLAVMAANAIRNYDVDRALELLDQIRRTCDPAAPREVLHLLK
jgi:ribosomal protein S20